MCQIHAVENHNSRLVTGKAVNVRVPAGHGDAGVEDFADRIYLTHQLLNHPLGLGHMAGKPLDVQFFKILFHNQ